MGPPVTHRHEDPTAAALDLHLEAVAALLPQVYGDTDASKQAQFYFSEIQKIGDDFDGLLCKRAALLYALATEKELSTHFAECERSQRASCPDPEAPSYVEDMHTRVLPLIMPRFTRNSCQTPDSFVVLANVLAELWPAEPIGNFPLRSAGSAGGSSGAGAAGSSSG
jgi:hypothetical protein